MAATIPGEPIVKAAPRAFAALAALGMLAATSPLVGANRPLPPGKAVFDRWCAACHAAGRRIPGTASLAVKYGKDLPAALEERADLQPEVVRYFVRQGVSIMPPFRKTEISDAELAALGAYLSRKNRDQRGGRTRD